MFVALTTTPRMNAMRALGRRRNSRSGFRMSTALRTTGNCVSWKCKLRNDSRIPCKPLHPPSPCSSSSLRTFVFPLATSAFSVQEPSLFQQFTPVPCIKVSLHWLLQPANSHGGRCEPRHQLLDSPVLPAQLQAYSPGTLRLASSSASLVPLLRRVTTSQGLQQLGWCK